MSTFSKILCAMWLAISVTSAYGDTVGYLAMDSGYRWDRIENRVLMSGKNAAFLGSTQTMRKINSYQLGGKGQLSFCDCAFVRAIGHYGWVFDGAKYSEGGLFGRTSGNTADVQVGIGQYFNMAKGVWAAPVFGWSYDTLLFKGTHIHTTIDGESFHLSDIRAHQTFNGPFIGFDVSYQINSCYDFVFGYEFHWSRWYGQRHILGPEYGNPPFGTTTGFSNKRHMKHVYGQVLKLDTSYQWCDGWELGLGLKYQFYTGDNGHYRQTKIPVISSFSYRKVDGLWWLSFAATFYAGKTF